MSLIRSKLRTSGNVVLDSNGNGQVMLTPDSASQSWEVTRVSVRTSQPLSQTPYPVAELFDTISPVPQGSYGATHSGHNDVYDVSGYPIDIGSQDAILVTWSGGIPGSTATVIVRGYKYLERV